MKSATYIHGTSSEEQSRLLLLNRLTNEAFLAYLELDDVSSVLEIGSGLGQLTGEVAQRVPRGEVWGVEKHPAQLAQSKQSFPHLHFVEGDAHALPFTDGFFDVVYGRYILEHLANPGQALREAHRVWKTGGKLFIQENNIAILTCYPELDTFTRVWNQFARLQKICDGDALIGKKLFSHFKGADFQHIKLSIQPEIHHAGSPNFHPWIENLIGNIKSGAHLLSKYQLASEAEIAHAMAELNYLAQQDDATIIFYWNRAQGVKV